MNFDDWTTAALRERFDVLCGKFWDTPTRQEAQAIAAELLRRPLEVRGAAAQPDSQPVSNPKD